MRKVQKKYYLPVETAEWLRDAAHRSRISQSRILEACLIMHMVHTFNPRSKR